VLVCFVVVVVLDRGVGLEICTIGNIASNLHTAISLQGIITRHKIQTCERRGLPSRLEDAIVDVLSRETRGGARCYVHWGVYESGKSRAASNAAIRLQEEHGKVVMLRHGCDFTDKTKLRDWLRISIGILDDRAEDKLSIRPRNKQVISSRTRMPC
jgi:hypothetical protein